MEYTVGTMVVFNSWNALLVWIISIQCNFDPLLRFAYNRRYYVTERSGLSQFVYCTDQRLLENDSESWNISRSLSSCLSVSIYNDDVIPAWILTFERNRANFALARSFIFRIKFPYYFFVYFLKAQKNYWQG